MGVLPATELQLLVHVLKLKKIISVQAVAKTVKRYTRKSLKWQKRQNLLSKRYYGIYLLNTALTVFSATYHYQMWAKCFLKQTNKLKNSDSCKLSTVKGNISTILITCQLKEPLLSHRIIYRIIYRIRHTTQRKLLI